MIRLKDSNGVLYCHRIESLFIKMNQREGYVFKIYYT